MCCSYRVYCRAASVLDDADTLLSGTALAAGIGFVNLFGAVGGFIAPILRVKAETLFASDAAGLLTLAAVAVIGSLIIFTLRVNRTVAQTDVAHH